MKNKIESMDNLWVYEVCSSELCSECIGIVLADTKEDALEKVTEMYEDFISHEDPDIRIFKAAEYGSYMKDYESILEIKY